MAHTPGTGLTRRQLLALGGGLASVGALAACGGNTGRDSSSGSGASAGASGGAGSGPALQQWYHQYGEAGTQQAVQKYAQAYSKAQVTVKWDPGDYDKTTAASLLTDGGPDVFEYGNGPTIDMIKGGQVADMTDLFDATTKADFNSSVLDRVTYNGKIWAIPQVVDMQLLVYRKSMLAAAGVTPPQTVEELMAAAGRLTQGKVKGLFVGNDGGVGVLGGPALWSAGLDYLNPDGSFGFGGTDAVAALTPLRELFTSGHLLLGAPQDWSDASALTSGLCAMQFTGLWTFPDIKKGLGDDFGVLPWPKLGSAAKGKATVPVGAYSSCVSSKSKNVDAAKQFAKWLWIDQTQDQLDFATAYGFHIPSRKSLIAKASILSSGQGADAAKLAVDNGHAQNPILWTPKCASAFSDMMTAVVKNGADIATEVAKVKTVADAEVARVKA